MSSSPMPAGRPPPRPITRLLIANRGEIATRVLTAAREHRPPIETYVLSTEKDTGHTQNAAHVLSLPSLSSYLDIPYLITLIRKHKIDAIHPGYGFLSESAEFSKRVFEETGATVIGPGWQILERTGDKLMAKALAVECGVPVLQATRESTGNIVEVKKFIRQVGLPVMVKAVDGGGGRGIRLIREEADIEPLTKRAIAESPSKQVFVEKAAVDGYRHVEVQIIGEGSGVVRHLWERECSIQRRYQKVVEVAPSTICDRGFLAEIIDAAIRIAESIKYFSLGTFEFLANPHERTFYFLEINPRLQVEHTVTESLCGVDILAIQLQLQHGRALHQTSLSHLGQDPVQPPLLHSLQLRICAEDAQHNFSLSIGKITSFAFPTGHGVRVDTALVQGHESVVSADYDSLIAKIIVTASSRDAVCQKARRALQDTRIVGVQTNLHVLQAVIASQAFHDGACDTAWFEANMAELVENGKKLAISAQAGDEKYYNDRTMASTSSSRVSNSSILFRKGDTWTVKLTPKGGSNEGLATASHRLRIEKVTRNEFPIAFSGEIALASSSQPKPEVYRMDLEASSASSASLVAAGKHRQGDINDNKHVVIPFSGKLVEVLVDEGDFLKAGDVICIVQQMKMELEVRCKKGGKISWIFDVEDGADVAEGDLVCVLEGDQTARL